MGDYVDANLSLEHLLLDNCAGYTVPFQVAMHVKLWVVVFAGRQFIYAPR